MVGVPGRSKGCVTCRKRKKGCDLKRPECGQCKERGITCGGYDSDRIFVYQSGGYNRFAPKVVRSTPTEGSGTRPFPQSMQIVPVRSVFDSGHRGRGQPCPVSVRLPESLTRSAYSEKSMEAFFYMYIPSGDFRGTNAEGKDFLNMLPLLSIREEALQMALLAIGTAALAKSTGDEGLTWHGRSLYGKALTEMAVALRSPSRAKSEALLAVPRVMQLFEILFGAEPASVSQSKSWLSHAEGEAALIFTRGPESYSENDAAHSIFTAARFRPLIAAVRTRKATILDDEDWKTLPWKNRIKSPEDNLLDILCGIPEILETIDKLSSPSVSERRKEGLRVVTVAKCWTMHFQLKDWLIASENEIHTPAAIDSLTPILFPDLETACLSVRYWVTALLLYSSLDIASGILPATDNSITHTDRPHPRQFARFIARSVSYFFQTQYGITGATTISFPLGNALFYMKRNPGVDREYMGMIMKALNDPLLPSTIRDFIASMRKGATMPAAKHLHGP